MKRILLGIISVICLFAHSLYAQENKAEVSIKFYDRTMYYPGDVKDNPVYVHVTIKNTGSDTYRFKLADDRAFSMDFFGFNVKNSQLPATSSLTRKRTTNNSVYFREIALEHDEEYSFIENLKDYLEITEPSIYYIELKFYPELYKQKNTSIVSNRLSLEIRPSPAAAASTLIPVESKTQAVLQPQEISPDKVIEQTIIARQKALWDQFFLYMDLEEILKRDPSRNRKYNSVSASERADMLESFKADLMLSRIDQDVVAIPSKFVLETTTYSQNEGTVKVKQWFKNDTYYEVKRYTYYVRQRDGIWQIYDYSVDNLGTE
ncbi:MAG: hypothetical protein J6O39_01570 [Treponema sp.]|uniref:Uncharacterized protein n=1 Tax=Treponema rectale TaxID=744512 RepID=A0A840SEC4_9SPIR|nr:hypothetical protein [Treponema rectale]MBB5218296.1 hypothetical protein [Treponema rectale]MBO6176216.1 hypothetical protein [Treponema sp.]